MTKKQNICKCGTNKNYLDCCGAYITNMKAPETPEQLMRSRYTAYAMSNMDYIANTMCGRASNGFDINDALLMANQTQWLRLEVLNSKLKNKNIGFVEFKAYYMAQGNHYILHEISEFQHKNGKWFYVNGVVVSNINSGLARKPITSNIA